MFLFMQRCHRKPLMYPKQTYNPPPWVAHWQGCRTRMQTTPWRKLSFWSHLAMETWWPPLHNLLGTILWTGKAFLPRC